jgi:hypothetical protein
MQGHFVAVGRRHHLQRMAAQAQSHEVVPLRARATRSLEGDVQGERKEGGNGWMACSLTSTPTGSPALPCISAAARAATASRWRCGRFVAG